MFLLSVRDASYKINRMVMGENSRHAEFAVISPSSTLTLKFREILEKRGLDCIVIQASQMDAPEVVSRLKDNGVKIFISRGNTAKILKKIVGITVIEARHTFFDCYYSYKNARKISDRIAFLATSIGYKDILDKCCPFMPGVVIFPLEPENGEAYIKTELGKLHDMGIEVAIGGLSLKPFVEAMGIRYVMTEADDDEVNDAIDEALYQLSIEHEREKRSEELEKRYVTIQTIMDSVSECIIRVDEHGIITDFNDYAVNLLPRIRKNLELSTIFPNCSSIATACMEGKHVNDEVVNEIQDGNPAYASKQQIQNAYQQSSQNLLSFKGKRLLEPNDFLDEVAKTDPWYQTILKAGYTSGPDFAALLYTIRKQNDTDPNKWILYISDDFKLLATDPTWKHNLTTKFSIANSKPVSIDIELVPQAPEGCPYLQSCALFINQ